MTTTNISTFSLTAYRAATFRYEPGRRVTSPAEAVQFVNERGYTFFWPVKGFTMPTLWVATNGDRPVPDEHDDPGHVTWTWKDQSLDKKWWYYSKLLRRRATFVSLDVIPYFYALSPNFGDPEEDYIIQYEEGNMTAECKQVYEAILKEGAIDSVNLRKVAHLGSAGSEGRFNKALEDLQVDLRILPVGVAQTGAWKYSFIYAPTHRHYPWLVEAAGKIKTSQARLELARLLLRSVGTVTQAEMTRLFRWKPVETERTVKALVEQGLAVAGVSVENLPGEFLAVPELVA